MKRQSIIALVVGLPFVALVWWIASNTYWEDTKVPMPLKGEALTNPFYAVERFAQALGAQTARERTLTIPTTDTVIVLADWHWNLSTTRQQALERWVEAGGRLVVDETLTGGGNEFERWSGIEYDFWDFDDADGLPETVSEGPEMATEGCRSLEEMTSAEVADGVPTLRYQLCAHDGMSFLKPTRPYEWALGDESGIQVARVAVGRGSVTVINASPFRVRNLFDGDHGWLFVAATQLRKNDHVLFLSEEDHASLLALLWRYGGPAVALALLLVALALWRGSIRFGPLMASVDPARRSLAEQIRGTGQFALRHGNGDALHAACVRALDEAAQRRVPHYAQLDTEERVAVLARVTGFERSVLAAAVHQTGVRRSHNLRSTIALLESVRRQLVIAHTK